MHPFPARIIVRPIGSLQYVDLNEGAFVRECFPRLRPFAGAQPDYHFARAQFLSRLQFYIARFARAFVQQAKRRDPLFHRGSGLVGFKFRQGFALGRFGLRLLLWLRGIFAVGAGGQAQQHCQRSGSAYRRAAYHVSGLHA